MATLKYLIRRIVATNTIAKTSMFPEGFHYFITAVNMYKDINHFKHAFYTAGYVLKQIPVK